MLHDINLFYAKLWFYENRSTNQVHHYHSYNNVFNFSLWIIVMYIERFKSYLFLRWSWTILIAYWHNLQYVTQYCINLGSYANFDMPESSMKQGMGFLLDRTAINKLNKLTRELSRWMYKKEKYAIFVSCTHSQMVLEYGYHIGPQVYPCPTHTMLLKYIHIILVGWGQRCLAFDRQNTLAFRILMVYISK